MTRPVVKVRGVREEWACGGGCDVRVRRPGQAFHDREDFYIIFRSKVFAIMRTPREGPAGGEGNEGGEGHGKISMRRCGELAEQDWPPVSRRVISRRVLIAGTMPQRPDVPGVPPGT